MNDKESIIQKIRKLLALAEGNQNEHERAVAMQFASDLLGKHNLSLAQVQGQALKIDVCVVDGNFKLERWIQCVLDAVCSLYYTDYYISTRKTAMFVGTAENIAVSIDVARCLIDSIRKESNRLHKDNHQRRSFRLGAAWKILLRSIDLIVEEKVSTKRKSPGTSLTIVRNQLERANEDYLSSLNLRRTTKRRVYVDEDAFDSGSSYADSVTLGKQAKRLPQKVSIGN
ncbi:MAG: DUF2786 domain-containing protein [Candidatus Obscuribacterales bacterium]|nr:DUF2786 domain-containing protein [Candidatus Obscuribacterales bacterium]